MVSDLFIQSLQRNKKGEKIKKHDRTITRKQLNKEMKKNKLESNEDL
jgi:hypothetical protein